MKSVEDSVLRRVKKCLALAKSSNANEAATALRHAQAIMREYDLSLADVEGVEVEDELVRTVEGYGSCAFIQALAGLMNDAFGVDTIMERNPGVANRANVRYVGAFGRAGLAAYAHRVIVRAVDAEWKAHLERNNLLKGVGGRRNAFRLGWLMAVRDQVVAIGISDAERAGIDSWKAKTYGKSLATQKAPVISMTPAEMRLAQAGHNAGKDFRLHRPVEGGTEAVLGIGVDG